MNAPDKIPSQPPIGHLGEYAHARDPEPSEDLAQWLSDVGRRTWRPARTPGNEPGDGAAESSEDLIRCLEELAGRNFRSREDLRLYCEELSALGREANRDHGRRQLVRDTVLLLGLVIAFTQYHLLDVSLQIARLPSTIVFVPAEARSAPPNHSAFVPRSAADPFRRT